MLGVRVRAFREAFQNFHFVFRLLGVNLLLAASTFLTSLILARSLGPESRGVLALVVLWPMLLSQISMMGVHLHLGRMIGKSNSISRNIYNHGLKVVALLSTMMMLIWGCVDLFTPSWPSVGVVTPSMGFVFIALGSIIIPFSAWNALQVQLELGRGEISNYNFARMSFAFLHLFMVGVVSILNISSPSIYLLCFTLSTIGASIVTNLIIRHSIDKSETQDNKVSGCIQGQEFSLFNTMVKSWPFAISTAAVSIMAMIDRLFISVIFDAKIMGLYVIAISITQLQSVVNESIAPLFFTKISQHDELKDVDFDWMSKRLRQTVAVNLFVSIFLLVISPLLLPLLFGSDYSGALVFVNILIPAVALRSAMRPYEEILKSSNNSLSQAATVSTMTIIFSIGALISALLGEPLGVPVALLSSGFVGLFMVSYKVAKHADEHVVDIVIPKVGDVYDLGAEAILSIRKMIHVVLDKG